jgi:hypothetical protein
MHERACPTEDGTFYYVMEYLPGPGSPLTQPRAIAKLGHNRSKWY